MKLGIETGSLVNSVMSDYNVVPEIGMGATILYWTDRKACTIINILKGVVTVRRDIATRIDGKDMSDQQAYTYTPSEDGATFHFKMNRSGRWQQVGKSAKGRWVFTNKVFLTIGSREEYFDFSF